jgi:hypothetical protein
MRYDAARRPPHGVLNPAGADHQSADRAGVLAPGLGPPPAADEDELLVREPAPHLLAKAVAGLA